MKSKKILIISNNVLSATNNNGKTLLSLFSLLPENTEISQLYFSDEQPTISNVNYFKISDRDLLNSKFKNKITYGKQKSISKSSTNVSVAKKHNNLMRLMREVLWINSHKLKELDSWVIKFNPSHIFFVGGDCLFAYKIFHHIYRLLSKRPICSLFITDDYVSLDGVYNPFELFRKTLIKRQIKKTLNNITHFFTISNKMKKYYMQLFQRESNILFNIQLSRVHNKIYSDINKTPVLLYAGSLYYGRDEAIANFILQTNSLKLLVCSNQVSNNNKFLKCIKKGKIIFLGQLSFSRINELYDKVDYLLYIESFRRKYVNKIKYSFSTKITDYLSSSLPIICYGPKDVGSIEEISQFCLHLDSEKISDTYLEEKIANKETAHFFSCKTKEGYAKVLNICKIKEDFLKAFGL